MNASVRMVGIAPAASPTAKGRWLRNPGGVARAEWFGAKGNGDMPTPTNDLAAIDKCLAKYGRVDPLAKTYLVRPVAGGALCIGVKTNDRIQGQGVDKTTLRMDASPDGCSAATAATIGTSTAPSDNVVISDLTIDCGFDQSNQKAARQEIVLQGANCVVDRVNVVHYTAAQRE